MKENIIKTEEQLKNEKISRSLIEVELRSVFAWEFTLLFCIFIILITFAKICV